MNSKQTVFKIYGCGDSPPVAAAWSLFALELAVLAALLARVFSTVVRPSAGGEAPRPSKFEPFECRWGGPTRLTKSRKLKPFRLAPVATGERGGSIRARRS